MGAAPGGQAQPPQSPPKAQRKAGSSLPLPARRMLLRQPLFRRAGLLLGFDLRRGFGLGGDRGKLAVAIGGDLP